MDNDDTVHRLDRRPRQNGPSPDFSEANGSWQSPKKTDALHSAYHRGRVAGLREAANECEVPPHEDGFYTRGDERRAKEIASRIRIAADKLEAETP